MKVRLVIDAAGDVRLPRTLQRALGVKAGDRLIAETTGEGVLLRPLKGVPGVEHYTQARIREFDEAERMLAAVLGSPRPRDQSNGAPGR